MIRTVDKQERFWPSTLSTKVDWKKRGQKIDGFGVFAGREEPFEQSKYRSKIIERLFSFDGLGLSIIRGQLYPNFNHLNHSFLPNDKRSNAQLVLFKEIKKIYNVNKFILSSWSPPYKWKTIFDMSFGRVGSNLNKLNVSKYDDFAKYIVNYIDFYRENDIDIYAISAQNEPEFPTTNWEGCVWFPRNLGHFLDKLKFYLKERNLDVKIIAVETGNWQTADLYLFLMRLFVKNSSDKIDILASHGYSFPQIKNLLVTYDISPRSWILNYNLKEKPRWITEASCTMKYDGSMSTAIKLAISLHNFLVNNNVSAYIYWLAMFDNYTNEALIFEDKDVDQLFYPKVYYIFGQFTKWIRPGMIRYDLKRKFFDYDITGTLSSIYLNEQTNDFALLIINPHKSIKSTFKIDFNGARIDNKMNLTGYKTNDQYNWMPISSEEFVLKNNGSLLILSNDIWSVKTLTGRLIFDF